MQPVAWQGWVVLVTGLAGMLASLAVPHFALREGLFFAAMFGMVATVYAKRARD